MRYFFLAFLMGAVLRFIATLGVAHYIQTSKTDSEMRSRAGFHISIVSYLFGSFLLYGGLALLIASLVKEYLL